MQRRQPLIGFRVEVIVETDEIGFHAYCPGLKGLHTHGDTEQEALQNAKDAAIAYLHSSIKHHDPIPVGILIREDICSIPHISKEQATYHTEDLKVACSI